MKRLDNLLAAAMCAFILFLLASTAAAGTIYVKWNSPSPDQGQSWDTAFHTVQAGIDAAVSGDEVRVAAGTYVESITLKDGIRLLGGYSGVGEERDRRAFVTVLDGSGASYVVYSLFRITRATQVDGFTITNRGSGVYCYMASPTISNNIIAPSAPPAIRCAYSASPLILNNSMIGTTGYGAIISINEASPIIAGNTITGGAMAISCYGSSPYITGNRVVGNVSQGGTYGMYCLYSSPIITNNLIADNTTRFTGSAIKCWYGDRPVVVNNTVVGNSCLPQQVPSGAIEIASPNAIVRNNLVAFNTTGICCYQTPLAFENNDSFGNDAYQYDGFPTDPTGTDGNISLDPMFRDLAAGDYRLRWDSPCVDAGTNDGAPETDILGVLRPIDGNWDGLAVTDIGAYEYAPLPVTVDILPGDSTNAIQPQPNRVITVAVLGNAGFDVRSIDAKSVTFGPGLAREVHKQGHFQDANSDGFTDLVLHFRCGDTGILPGSSTVVLRGRLSDGERIEGSDMVRAR